jgi:hypothetical protein
VKIKDVLNEKERFVIYKLRKKIDEAKTVEDIKMHRHHISLVIENAAMRLQIKELKWVTE